MAENRLHGVKICCESLEVLHLFFNNDILVLIRANEDEVDTLGLVLIAFEEVWRP